MRGNKAKTILFSAMLIAVLALTGCGTPSGGNNGGGGGISTPQPTTPPVSTPTPTPTPTEDPDDHAHEHEEIDQQILTLGADYTRNFALVLTDRSLSTEAWRAAVIPSLYDKTMQDLYSTLDPYSLPFCSTVSSVNVGAISTFSVVYKVNFENSTSFMTIEVMDISQNIDGSQFTVLAMNSQMNDAGGC